MDIPNIPRIFFIKGVFKHTARSIEHVLEEQMAKANLDASIDNVPCLLKFYDPSKDDEWLAQRQVSCASCSRIINGRHIFVPQMVEKTKSGLKFKCFDTTRFCAWWCAARHIRYFLDNDSRFKLLLNKLYECWENQTVIEIDSALPPWRCVEFGGDLTLDGYHKLNEYNFKRFQSSFDNDNDHESFDSKEDVS